MYVDPNGEWINFVIGAVVGFINGFAQGAQIASAKGATGWAKFGYMMAGAHIGAAIGVATAGLGTGISTGLANVGVNGIGGIAGGAITGAVTGAVSGATTGLAMGGLAGMKGNDLWKQVGIGAGMGAAMGAAMGALSGMADALDNDKNVWLGRDIGKNRTAWSLKNTDKASTHWFTEDGAIQIDHSSKYLNRVYKKERGYRQGVRAKYENWVHPDNPQRTIPVGYMQGSGDLNYSGWVTDGYNLNISFDGKNVLSLPPGSYPETTIPVPSGTQSIKIELTPVPSLMPPGTEKTVAPFKSIINGIWKP